MDLVEKLRSMTVFSKEEVHDMLLEARKRDEKRDPVEVQRTVGAYMARLKEIDALGSGRDNAKQIKKAVVPPTRRSMHSPRGADSVFRSPSPLPLRSPIRPLVEAIREAGTPQKVAPPPLPTSTESAPTEVKIPTPASTPTKDKEAQLETVSLEKSVLETEPEPVEDSTKTKREEEIKEESMEVDQPVKSAPTTPAVLEEPVRKRGRPPKDKTKISQTATATPTASPAPPVELPSEARSRRSSFRTDDNLKKDEEKSRRGSSRRTSFLEKESSGPTAPITAPATSTPLVSTPTQTSRDKRKSRTHSHSETAAAEVNTPVVIKEEVDSAPPSAPPSEAAFPAPAPKMSPPPAPSVAVGGDKSKPLPSEQLKSPSVAPVAVGSVSVETQTEVSIRVPLITMQNSGSGSRKTSHARRTARVPTSVSSDSKELHRSVNVQTGRVEFGQYDEIMVIRRQPMSTLKRNFVMIEPLDGASNEGYGSDDEALSTVKRRIRDPESHDTKRDLGSRMHNVHYDMPEIESQFPMDSRAEDPASSKKSKKDSSEKKMTKDELMAIKNNLITYWRQVHAHRYSSIFAHPVSEKDAPGYSKIVKKPMDLWTLKRAIESNEVLTVSAMRHRLMLMYSNAVMFNSTGHDVNTSAIDMANDTIEVFKRLEDTKNKSFHTLSRRSAKLNAEENISGRRDSKPESTVPQKTFSLPNLGSERVLKKRLQGEDEFPILYKEGNVKIIV